jgi:hypothetical protein
MASTLPIAGWYPDPEIPGQDRWWDGTTWSETRRASDAARGAASAPVAPQQAAPPPAAAPVVRNNAALIGLILSLSGFLLPLVINSFAGGIVSIVGLRRSTQLAATGSSSSGRGMSIAGILVGFIWGGICLIGIAAIVLFYVWILGVSSHVQYPDSPVI